MGTLRTQMTHDMLVRGLAEQTQKSYLRAVTGLGLAWLLSAITRTDLVYAAALAERLPAWLPARDRILDLGRRSGANV